MTNDELQDKIKLAEMKHYAMVKNGFGKNEAGYADSAKALANLYAQDLNRPIQIPLGSKYRPL